MKNTVEKRTILMGFQTKQSESDRIEKVIAISGKRKSDYLRDLVMKDVEKQERKSQ